MEKQTIKELTNRINSLPNISALIDFEKQSTLPLEHPYPQMLLGYKYSILGDNKIAYKKFRNCIKIEINSDGAYLDTIFADSVGLAISNICLDNLTDNKIIGLPKNISDSVFYFWLWGYYYLSYHLVNYNYSGYNSIENRARLLEKFPQYASSLSNIFCFGTIPNVLVASDYFLASKLYSKIGDYNKSSQVLQNAKLAHRWLEDISVSGQDANEYSLEELSKIGMQRHEKILNNIKNKFDFKSKMDSYLELLDYF